MRTRTLPAPAPLAAAVATEPAPPAIPAEPDPLARAWEHLASGTPGAMGAFASLVAADPKNESARLGYAIAAASAGQFDRAEWAAAGVKSPAATLAAAPVESEGVRRAVERALGQCSAGASTSAVGCAEFFRLLGPGSVEPPPAAVSASR